MLSSRIGLRTGRPTISLQRESESPERWRLSFSSGNAEVELYTDAPIRTTNFEHSSIKETDYGYSATVVTIGPPRSEGEYDAIIIKGPFSQIGISNDRECDFYMNDERVATGKEYTYGGRRVEAKLRGPAWKGATIGATVGTAVGYGTTKDWKTVFGTGLGALVGWLAEKFIKR